MARMSGIAMLFITSPNIKKKVYANPRIIT